MTSLSSYQSPLSKLLNLGDYREFHQKGYDYIAELGFGSQHIPQLIQMSFDKKLIEIDSDSSNISLKWAPIHAWKVLGLLRAEEAIEPLMQLFHEWEDNDWVAEEMPKIYGIIGKDAIAPLQSYIQDNSHGVFPRVTAVNSLQEISRQHPQLGSECICALSNGLKSFAENPPELNGFIIVALIELKAKESALIIKDAFAENRVAEDIIESWEEVVGELGITQEYLESLIEVQVNQNILEGDIRRKETSSQRVDLEGIEELEESGNQETENNIPDVITQQISSENLPVEDSSGRNDNCSNNLTSNHLEHLTDENKVSHEIPQDDYLEEIILDKNSKIDIKHVNPGKLADELSDNLSSETAEKKKEKSSLSPEFKSAIAQINIASSVPKKSNQGFAQTNNSQSKQKKVKSKKKKR